jgi:triacylglycerol esterase/lipase EstA (alpha/beta hydrolase family)
VRFAWCCALVAIALASTAGVAGANPSYPVSYSLIHAGASAFSSSTNGPTGANDFSCKPSARHPYPIVLVHGLMANKVDNWDTIAPLLADNGFCVFALTYGTTGSEPYFGGLQAMEQSSQELGPFVDQVLAATGASKVDLVGHSEGTVMPRYWMEFGGGAAKVDKYVMLTPIWHGTNVLGAATLERLGNEFYPAGVAQFNDAFGSVTGCRSCTEFLTGSQFMTNLNAHGMALPGVTYTNIMTRYDELVVPYTSGIVNAPNVTNIVLQKQCSLDLAEHAAVAYDPTAAQDVLNALDPAHAKRVPCVPVLPAVGALYPPSGVGLTP